VSTQETPRLHERVRFTRPFNGLPDGAIGWIIDVGDGWVSIELEDPDLSPDLFVDVTREDMDVLERIPAD
jgi:hypothetical protein